MKDFNQEINQGETYILTITVSGTDLTGYSVRSQFRRDYDSQNFDLEMTDGNGLFVITDAAGGVIVLTLPDTTTSALNSRYVYDVEIVSLAGVVTRILQGSVEIDPEATK